MPGDREKLLQVGFQTAGRWYEVPGGINFHLTSLSNTSNVLYAFVSNGSVQYIGKSVRTLQQRMQGYRSPGPSQLTNLRNKSLIKELLRKGSPVEILAFAPSPLRHEGFAVNLAAGLEDSLIEHFKPPWNLAGTLCTRKLDDRYPPACGTLVVKE